MTYTRLTDGVDTPPHVTAMDEAMYFDFDLSPRTDAVLTLDVSDGDAADLHVLGPTIPATTGLLLEPLVQDVVQHPQRVDGRHRVHLEPRGVGGERHWRHLPRGRLGLVLRGAGGAAGSGVDPPRGSRPGRAATPPRRRWR